MPVAIYARVSSSRQTRAQSIEEQLTRLQSVAAEQGWTVEERHIYRDDGYSGARLNRPGLDRLRDAIATGDLDRVLITAPDRLARKYVHQVLLLEEWERAGCQVQFADRPMSQDPSDQLLLQIRGAVAEYERCLISERMRRGRVAKLRTGQLLPWQRVPFGYQVDPYRPRDPRGVRVDEAAAPVVRQLFTWYLQEDLPLRGIALRLTATGLATPTGKAVWSTSTVRWILRNPTYTGTTYGNCTRQVAARSRRSPLIPVGSGQTTTQRPADEWIPIAVPALISQEEFDLVQEKLALSQQRARRNNTQHQYLLRASVSCGQCQRCAPARTTWDGYSYYVCNGQTALVAGPRCRARHIPAGQLDALVWTDLCAVLTQPTLVAEALQRAQSGCWLPQELQARQRSVQDALAQIARQQQRLLDAYVAGILELAEFNRKRQELRERQAGLQHQ